MNAIVLVGFMGAGKTTVGQLLSHALDVSFIDFDQYLVKRLGMSVADYFATFGEEAFRQQESLVLKEVMVKPAVLSTGGGIVLKELNRTRLKQMEQVIYLSADPETVYERITKDERAVRPLAQRPKEDLIALYESRMALYQEVATFTVDTTTQTPSEIVASIIKQLKKEGRR